MTTNDDQTTGQLPSKISRRTLAAGAAWSVPVIAVASAAPAFALSGDCVDAELSGCSYKEPGAGNDWAYHFEICFINTCDNDVEVTITKLQTNSGVSIPLPSPATITVPANKTACTETIDFNSSNSAAKIQIWVNDPAPFDPKPDFELPSPPDCDKIDPDCPGCCGEV